MTATPADIAKVMNELGCAIRGDWSQDGRGIQMGINCVTERIIDGSDPAVFVEKARDDLGICPHGMGHWTEYCEDGWCDTWEAQA